MDKESVLLEIFANDPDGILEVKAKPAIRSSDDRLVASFEEINDFLDKYNREPQRSLIDIQEVQLYSRLKGMREDAKKIEALKIHDRHQLLAVEEEKEINSLDDIFCGDSFGLLEDEADIFRLTHVERHDISKAEADFVATREKCEEFEKYENLFKECQTDLREGQRRLVPPIEKQLHVGTFCVLDGVLLYIAEIKHAKRGNSNKLNRRTLLIFENGTQSRMLLRSLGKRLNKDSGKMVTSRKGKELAGLNQISADDKSTGYIYVLKSKSEDEKIQSIENLYKIGFSKGDVKERVKNAETEPTYLMAPVLVISVFECYNMNTQKFEHLLHKFFASSCLNIDIFDKAGERYMPREWFVAPLSVIEETIELIINGNIVDYVYDSSLEMIVSKDM